MTDTFLNWWMAAAALIIVSLLCGGLSWPVLI